MFLRVISIVFFCLLIGECVLGIPFIETRSYKSYAAPASIRGDKGFNVLHKMLGDLALASRPRYGKRDLTAKLSSNSFMNGLPMESSFDASPFDFPQSLDGLMNRWWQCRCPFSLVYWVSLSMCPNVSLFSPSSVIPSISPVIPPHLLWFSHPYVCMYIPTIAVAHQTHALRVLQHEGYLGVDEFLWMSNNKNCTLMRKEECSITWLFFLFLVEDLDLQS